MYKIVWCTCKGVVLLRDWPYDVWEGGGRYGWLQKKIYPVDWFQGGEIRARKYLATFLQWIKVSSIAYNARKKSYTVVCQEKNISPQEVWEKNKFLPKPNHPYPLPLLSLNSQMVDPLFLKNLCFFVVHVAVTNVIAKVPWYVDIPGRTNGTNTDY